MEKFFVKGEILCEMGMLGRESNIYKMMVL